MVQIPLTPEQFTSLQARAQQHGIPLDGDKGTISKSGVTADYTFDGANLSVTITGKPFFVSTEYCEEQLRSFLAKAL